MTEADPQRSPRAVQADEIPLPPCMVYVGLPPHSGRGFGGDGHTHRVYRALPAPPEVPLGARSQAEPRLKRCERDQRHPPPLPKASYPKHPTCGSGCAPAGFLLPLLRHPPVDFAPVHRRSPSGSCCRSGALVSPPFPTLNRALSSYFGFPVAHEGG